MVKPLLLGLLALPWLTAAQPAGPSRPDPLMSLLMSQPRTDIPSNVVATSEFDPPIVRPGELSVYRVNFNAVEESINWPEQLSGPAGLDLRPGGRGQIMQPGGAGFAPRTGFNYHARATRAGELTIPAFTVQVYGKPVTVPAARLAVTTSPPPNLPSARRLLLELPSTNLYVGQPIRARVTLAASAVGQFPFLAQAELNGDGLFVDQGTARMQTSQAMQGGRMVIACIYEATLTALKAGHLSLAAQGFTGGTRAPGLVVLPGSGGFPGGMPLYVLVDSEPVALNVRSLPRDGELPGFTGAIGNLSLDPPRVIPDSVQVGDSLTLSVTVHGDGTLARLPAPPPPTARDWQIFSGASETPPPPAMIMRAGGANRGAVGAAATFTYTLIPLSETVRATPVIPFCYFDPARGAYVPLPIPSVPLTVRTSPAPVDLAVLARADTGAGETEKEPVLSDLAATPGVTASTLVPVERRAWFPWVQCAPALAFAALWGWDRRRRYLEHHPEVLLRARARRALRRQRQVMRRAARAGDAPGFAAAAVNAMRIACAPHYPAEPQALVGADVLAVLPAEHPPSAPSLGLDLDFPQPAEVAAPAGPPGGRAARWVELVRRFFTVADAARFGEAGADASALLPMAAEIEELLTQLEAKLCG